MPADSQDRTNWYFLSGKGAFTRIFHCRETRGELGRFRAAEFLREDSAENTPNMEFSIWEEGVQGRMVPALAECGGSQVPRPAITRAAVP
jgi:hypothetical protein